ncbi:MAG: hypothetical protein ACWA6X_11040 [Bauldia sp.]|jgi:hypothetical protein
MKRLVALAAAVSMLPLAVHAQTPAPDPQLIALRDCIVANSTGVEVGMARSLLAAALEDDADVTRTYLTALRAQIATIGGASCGATTETFAAPWAANIGTEYLFAMLNRAVGQGVQFIGGVIAADAAAAAAAAPAGGAGAPAFQIAP